MEIVFLRDNPVYLDYVMMLSDQATVLMLTSRSRAGVAGEGKTVVRPVP